MKLRIEGASPFRDGEALYFPGDYRIPLDMTEEVAQKVVAAGCGQMLKDEPSKTLKVKKQDDHLA
jgi:hypothetical protein